MSQAAAEVLATLAHQHVRRGTPQDIELAEVFERMADRMQGGIVGGYRPSAGGPIPAAPAPVVTHASERRTAPTRVAEPCHEKEAAIVDAIKRSVGGISAQELGAVADVNPRMARAIIAHCRADHRLPICSSPAEGYFWPRRAEDTRHTLASLESRRIEIEAAIAGIREGATEEFGTGVLPGIGER